MRGFEDSVNVLKRLYKCDVGRRCSTLTRNLRAVLSAEYPWVLVYIDDDRCPFCGEQFATKRGLWLHLRRKCSAGAKAVVSDVIEKYLKARRHIVKVDHKTYIRWAIRGTHLWYDTFEEAYAVCTNRNVIFV